MSQPSIVLSYQGLSVTLQDRPGAGQGSLGVEDVAAVRLPTGEVVEGTALAERMTAADFSVRVSGVIDAYGPIISRPYHGAGKAEWPRLLRFWTQAQPEFWLEYVGRHPAEADANDFALREEFRRADGAATLPLALEEAVEIQRMRGRIRTLYRPSLGLRRFNTLTDQRTIDEEIVGPVVRQYGPAVAALLHQLGQTPLAEAILATTAWKDKALHPLLPSWAIAVINNNGVAWIPDEAGLAVLEAAVTTPESAMAHADEILNRCGWLTLVPKERMGQEWFDRLYRLVMKAVDLLSGDRTSRVADPGRILMILTDGQVVADMSPGQALEVIVLADRLGAFSWGHWAWLGLRVGADLQSSVEARWRKATDVEAMAAALLALRSSHSELVMGMGDFFLDLTLALHNRLPNESTRAAVGAMIVALIEDAPNFRERYSRATRAHLAPPTDAHIEALPERRAVVSEADREVETRFIRWIARQPELPEAIDRGLAVIEEGIVAVGDLTVGIQAEQAHEWWRNLTPDDAKIVADQLLVWWQYREDRGPGRRRDGFMVLHFLQAVHNRLTDPADRARVGEAIAECVGHPRVIGYAFPWATELHLLEPTRGRLQEVLETALQSDQAYTRRQAGLAQLLSEAHLPHTLNFALRLANPSTLEFRFHNDILSYECAVATDPWFSTLGDTELATLADHLFEWHEYRRDTGWRLVREQARLRIEMLGRIHNQTAQMPLRERIAGAVVEFARRGGEFQWVIAMAERLSLASPAREAVAALYDELKARTAPADRRTAMETEQWIMREVMLRAVARGTMPAEERDRMMQYAAWHDPVLIQSAYPLLTVEERARLEAAAVATLTWSAADDDPAMRAAKLQLRRAFQPLHDQLSPTLQQALEDAIPRGVPR